MSAQPGWYPLPDNEGMMDYWDGAQWSGNVRPVPPTQPPAPSPDSQPISVPESNPQSLPCPTENPWAPENIIEQVKDVASDKRNQATGMQAGGGALIADGVIGFGEKRAGIFGAIGTIFFGVFWLAITSFFFSGTGMQDHEAKTSGTVQSVRYEETRDSDGDWETRCYPEAFFVVDGERYTATPDVSISPCPWNEGETVDVFYDKSEPSDAHISTVEETKIFRIIFPAVGVFIILAGIGTFIKRAASIGAGIWLWRKGTEKKEKLGIKS